VLLLTVVPSPVWTFVIEKNGCFTHTTTIFLVACRRRWLWQSLDHLLALERGFQQSMAVR